jgi:hypothetical protein
MQDARSTAKHQSRRLPRQGEPTMDRPVRTIDRIELSQKLARHEPIKLVMASTSTTAN